MNPALRVLATLVVALVAGALLLSSWRSRTQSFEARLERAQLKREFLERGSVGRQLPPARAREWRDEARALVRWYFDELAAVKARHPGERRPGAAPQEKDPKRRADLDEWRRYAAEREALLRDGRYEPLVSGADQGLHLDVLSVEPAQNPAGGERALKVEFALWGAPRRIEKEAAATGRTTSRVVVPVAFKEMAVRFTDEKGKPYGEMTGSGEPYQKLADPERFAEDFPPGILFGTWYLELFPREAAKAELAVAVEVRGAAGTPLSASYALDLPLRESWKLPVGQAFKAQVREAVQ